ncbi:MAG: FAD-dependent oxidoreductase [Burkholderiaceae bacterium]
MNHRRYFIRDAGALLSSVFLSSCATLTSNKKDLSLNTRKNIGSVVIVGGGFSGASLARYLSILSRGRITITLINKSKLFYSCPMSNLVLTGDKSAEYLSHEFSSLVQRGISVLYDEVTYIDPIKKTIRTLTGKLIQADHLVVCPGIDLEFSAIDGFDAVAQRSVLHAWQGGTQTLALRRRLLTLSDGGVFLISIPPAPYRCPPGPYERASLVANYFKRYKPKSKVLVLDANPDVQSKKELFVSTWTEKYVDNIEYISDFEVKGIDPKRGILISQFGDKIKGDVLNVIPPNSSAKIAHQADLVTDNDRWCDVNWRSMESVKYPGVYVLGDATLSAEKMPKSAHMANQHSKIAALDIIAKLDGKEGLTDYKIVNTCYSFVDEIRAIFVSQVYSFELKTGTVKPIKGAGGLPSEPSVELGRQAYNWAEKIWLDSLG